MNPHRPPESRPITVVVPPGTRIVVVGSGGEKLYERRELSGYKPRPETCPDCCEPLNANHSPSICREIAEVDAHNDSVMIQGLERRDPYWEDALREIPRHPTGNRDARRREFTERAPLCETCRKPLDSGHSYTRCEETRERQCGEELALREWLEHGTPLF